MKKNTLLLIGVGGLVAYALSKRSTQNTIGDSGLTQSDFNTAVVTDSFIGSTAANAILSAPNAATALILGNQALQIQSGLDLTNPVWQQSGYTSVPVADQVVNGQPTQVLDAEGAKAIIATTTPTQDQIILSEPSGGNFPRMVGNIFVLNPNQLEHLKHAVEDAAFRAQRGY